MIPFPALTNLVYLLLIVFIQYVYNDHLRIQFRKELVFALDGWRIHSRHNSKNARFTAMSADSNALSQ